MASGSTNKNTGSREAYSERLGTQICDLYAQINVATYQLLVMIAEFERNSFGDVLGFTTTANWLSWNCGIGLVAAREKVRVALALEELPLVARAFSKGQLSYSKVRAITRVADSDNEETMLDIARESSASQCERIFRQYQQTLARPLLTRVAGQPELPANDFSHHWDEDGCLVFNGRLSPEQGALLLAAMQQQIDAGSAPTDALSVVAQAGMANTTMSPAIPQHNHRGRNAERYTINVEIGGATQSLRDGPGLSDAIVERLTCDASLVVHSCDEHCELLNIGRKSRTVPPSIYRALERRDQGCRFPGCTHNRFVDAHHVVHWAQGGETKLSNLVLLCTRHHKAIHEEGFRIEIESVKANSGKCSRSRIDFYTPTGKYLPPLNDGLTRGRVSAIYPCFDPANDARTTNTTGANGANGTRINRTGDSAESRTACPTSCIDYRQLYPRHPTRNPDYGYINEILTYYHPGHHPE